MKLAIVYWTGTGNTEAMAQAMGEGAQAAGAEVQIFAADAYDKFNVADFDGVLFGCPAMGNEVLEESEFEPMFEEVESKLSGVPVGLFGSYGWGDGEWMTDWQKRCQDDGAKVFCDGIMVNNTPDDAALEECKAFGENFVKANA